MKSKILILGSRGRLGRAFCKWKTLGYDIIPIFQKVEDDDFLIEYNLNKNDIVINCAAYTDVEKSNDNEKEWSRCQHINTFFPHILSQASKELGFKLVLFSSDYVLRERYDNNNYTKTKKNMEGLCAPNSLIIRLSNLIGKEDKKNTNIVSKLLNQESPLRLIDVYIHPILLNKKSVDIIWKIILSKKRKIVNLFGKEIWLPDFAKKLFEIKNKNCEIEVNSDFIIDRIHNRYVSIPFDWSILKKWVN